MSRPELPSTVLVIGSGPVTIGQAAEFDYAGSQACLSLREEGIRVVLLNSNPATIQTDYSVADRIYIEPITPETVARIIEREKVDAILPSVGGQTALNLVVRLEKSGMLSHYGVQVLGTPVSSIDLSEDRHAFHRFLEERGFSVANSWTISGGTFEEMIDGFDESAYIIRTSFSLGGSGGTLVPDRETLTNYCRNFFSINPGIELDVEQSLLGLTELEYEMIRDSAGNCISVCNMENLDPMGVHTGESIVVTPSMTLTDREYHELRSTAKEVIGALGIIGACNIQFALNRKTGDYFIVEVNPRTSRSSALASKSTGYPIARISAKIALGYLIGEIRNPITLNTYAASEPSLDYVTVKIPRWPFDKFDISREIGVQMKSIGEVMGIGRTFEESLMKAISSLETKDSAILRLFVSDSEIESLLKHPSDRRIYAIFEALFRRWRYSTIAEMSGYSPFFIERMDRIVIALRKLSVGEVPSNILECKELGISDSIISAFTRLTPLSVTEYRLANSIIPSYRSIDTCSGEFEAATPYLYSTYTEESDPWTVSRKKKIIILGSGPNRISQGLEFDYGAVKAVGRLRNLGYEAIMINSNPETVSTDFDVSDRLYFEPVTLEHVANIVARERPHGIIIQFSGQTGQNMATDLEEIFGASIFLGTRPKDIFRIEDRGNFAATVKRLGLKQPEFHEVYNENDSDLVMSKLQLPLIVRSSFIIGGRAMDVIYDRKDGLSMISEALKQRPGSPVLISRYIEGATEIDVDFISNGSHARVCGMAVHVEEAGTHSGDATMVVGPDIPDPLVVKSVEEVASALTEEFHLSGLSNLQIMLKDEFIYIIELNARASRSVPFISKACGTDFVALAVDMMTGHASDIDCTFVSPYAFAVKIPVFPFLRFPDMDTFLSPEMKSTGEGMSLGLSLTEAFEKAMDLYYHNGIGFSDVILSIGDDDKSVSLEVARLLDEMGSRIYATPGTSSFLSDNGIDNSIIYKLEDLREPRIDDVILNGSIGLIINTPGMRNRHRKDGIQIRRIALMKGIPLITNLRLAETAIRTGRNPHKAVFRELAGYYGKESQ